MNLNVDYRAKMDASRGRLYAGGKPALGLKPGLVPLRAPKSRGELDATRGDGSFSCSEPPRSGSDQELKDVSLVLAPTLLPSGRNAKIYRCRGRK